MTTEEITQENQDQDPQELLQRMEETAWRQGQPGLEFFFSYRPFTLPPSSLHFTLGWWILDDILNIVFFNFH